jgi:hypothetical protein
LCVPFPFFFSVSVSFSVSLSLLFESSSTLYPSPEFLACGLTRETRENIDLSTLMAIAQVARMDNSVLFCFVFVLAGEYSTPDVFT